MPPIFQLPTEIFAALLSGPLLEITLANSQTWHIHLNLLRHHSPSFRPINGEETPTHLDLSSHDPAAFRILVKWLYQGAIEDVSTLPGEKKWEYTYACQNLYLLCEKLEIRGLQNLAIDQFRKGCYETKLVPGAEEVMEVYKGVPEGNMLRKLVAKIAARQILDPEGKGAEGYVQVMKSWPEFCVDVLNAVREGVGGVLLDDPTAGSGCKWHVHDGEKCKSVRFEDTRVEEQTNGQG